LVSGSFGFLKSMWYWMYHVNALKKNP
jgi:hypothetical protein